MPWRTTSGHQWSPRVRRRVFDAALAMGSKQRSHVSSNGMRASRHALCSRASSVRKWWQGAFFSTRTHAARLPMVTSLMPTAFSSGSSVSFDAHLWAVPHSLLRLLSRAADIISAYLVGQNGGWSDGYRSFLLMCMACYVSMLVHLSVHSVSPHPPLLCHPCAMVWRAYTIVTGQQYCIRCLIHPGSWHLISLYVRTH